MGHLGDDLKVLRKSKDMTQEQMADFLSVSHRSYQEIEKTGFVKKLDTLLRIYKAAFPDKYKSGDFKRMGEQAFENTLVNETENPYLKARLEKKNSIEPNTLLYYDINATAGAVDTPEILPTNKNEGVLHISDLFKGSQYAIRLSGNSMTPNYPPGAIIGIREIHDKRITPGSVYVIEKENDLWIKRLFYKNDDQTSPILQCISDNAMKYEGGARQGKLFYPPFEIEIDSIRKLFKVTGIYKPNDMILIS